MPAGIETAKKWVLKIVPVADGYDVYTEVPTLAFYGHAKTLDEAKAIAARQPTKADAVRMLLATS